jgi:hypothetical protein
LPEPAFAQAVAKIRAGGADGPALELLVHDFTTYHLAMGAVVTADLVIGAVMLWRRRPGCPPSRNAAVIC